MTTPSQNVLIVDDDADALLSLVRALKTSGIDARIHAAGSSTKALELQKEICPEVAVVDLCLDEKLGVQSGFSLIEKIRSQDNTCRIIVLTGHGSTEHGVKALAVGATSFLEKPAHVPHLAALIRDGISYSLLKRHVQEQHRSTVTVDVGFIGASEAAQRVVSEIKFAAYSPQSVFIGGETGTGKSLCAKLIHQLGTRSTKRFIRYQPTFASADLINSDLFGHKKGSFTGASEDRRGLIAECAGGTLFLDEVDELPLETQVLLLGVLQDRTYRPLGSNEEIVADFRLIAASNADIQYKLSEGKLRKDFYHRIAHCTIALPPLRERKSDIRGIAERFLSTLCQNESVAVIEFSESALEALETYSWPGNVRELEAIVQGAAFRAEFNGRRMIERVDIALPGEKKTTLDRDNTGFNEMIASYKQMLIKQALERNQGNQVRAAKELGLDRSTLRRIIASAE